MNGVELLLNKIGSFESYSIFKKGNYSYTNTEWVKERKEKLFCKENLNILRAIDVTNPFVGFTNIVDAVSEGVHVFPFQGALDEKIKPFCAQVVSKDGIIKNIANTEPLARLKEHNTPTLIFKTSGTTGSPKFIIHDANKFFTKYLKLKNRLKTLLVFPIDHISGFETTLSTISAGGKISYPESASVESVLQALTTGGFDFISCTPTYLRLLLLAGGAAQLAHLKFINIGGEKSRHTDIEFFAKCLPNTKIRQAYGTTETSNIRTFTETSNRIYLGVKNELCKIKDDILWLKLPDSTLGYLFDDYKLDAWYCTDDRVKVHSDGSFTILGRKTDIINVGGEKVDPKRVEEVILQFKGVDQVSVFGENNLLSGQHVAARINASEFNETDLRIFCKKYLSDYEIPQRIYRLESADIKMSARLKQG